MIRHIVMWKFRPGTEAEQERFLAGLQGLQGVIPQLRRSEVARSVGADNYDAVLVSEFDTLADLELYKNDPRHKAVSALCKSIREDRVAVDYALVETDFIREQTSFKGSVPSGLCQLHRAIRAKRDTLCFQQRPLGAGGQGIEAGLGASQPVHHPVAGNRFIPAGCQGVSDHPGTAGHAGQTGDLTVGGGASGRNLPDYGVDAGKGSGRFCGRHGLRGCVTAGRPVFHRSRTS